MPHVIIKIYQGRDETTKLELANSVADTVSNQLKLDKGTVSVSIEEIPKENWKSEVYDKLAEDDTLCIKPSYTM